MSKELTPEEKAYFESNGQADLPDDYVKDLKQPEYDSDEGDAEAAKAEDTANEGEGGNEDTQSAGTQASEEEGQAQPKKRNEQVPLATYLEEKKARQERERQIAELNAQFARADERLLMIAEAQQQQQRQAVQQKEAPPPPPNPEEDPIGALKWMQDNYLQDRTMTMQERQEQARRQQEMEQRRQYEQNVTNAYSQAFQEAMAVDPSIQEARQFALKHRFDSLVAMGMPPQAAEQQLRNDEFEFVAQAMQNRKNPAAAIYELARSRGWQPQQAQNNNVSGNEAADRLKAVQAGQASSASLSKAGTGATARSGKLDAKALAEMSDKEFAAFLKKDEDGDNWKKIMGG